MPNRIVDDGAVVSFAVAPAAARASRSNSPLLPLEPGVFDLGVYRGDTYEWFFRLLAKQYDEVSGAWVGTAHPVDISGWRFRAEIRSSVDGTLMGSLQEMSREAEAGLLRMRLPANQSRMVTGPGVWDLEAVTADGWVKTVLRGSVRYLGDVTTGIPPYLRRS